MSDPVTVRQAADALGVSIRRVQLDIANGCAGIVRLGSQGRGNGSLLDIDLYQDWRARRAGFGETDIQRECERVFVLSCGLALRTFQEYGGNSRQSRAQSAGTLCHFLMRLAPLLLGHEIEDPPEEMRTLLHVYVECSRL